MEAVVKFPKKFIQKEKKVPKSDEFFMKLNKATHEIFSLLLFIFEEIMYYSIFFFVSWIIKNLQIIDILLSSGG